jgi:uncharacterized protein (UPF0261 family)
MLDVEGEDFFDSEADAALFDALRDTVDEGIELIEMDANVNDESFALALAEKIDAYMQDADAV